MEITLLFSVLANCCCAYLLFFKKKEQPLTTEAKDLLRDLLSGTALIKIDVIDKQAIFLRSPKDL